MCCSGTLTRSAMPLLAVLAFFYIEMYINPTSFLRISVPLIIINHEKT
jgi:hypothetical protein